MSKSKDVMKKDEVFQAILIAEGFNDDFKPITDDIPLSLLPVVNKPLIDYTLNFLSLGGIEETFLFCCSRIEDIRTYIKKCKEDCSVVWAQTMKVHVVVSETCGTLGDCMRDIDAKGLIRGNFVLIEPGVVSNIKLLPLMKRHNDMGNKDKGAAMTIVCQESGLGQYNRCSREELVIVANSNTNRLLYYKKIGLALEKKLKFPLEIFLDNSPVSIHHNIKDTFIAICSAMVLPLFSDNFDFQTKDDFVRGLIMNEEILGCTVYWHLVKGSQHSGTVSNLRMYHAVSQEIIANRLFPIRTNLHFDQNKSNRSVIGEKCIISKSAKLLNAVLGNNVTLGDNVTINNSYIHDNVKIYDNCKITTSILSNNCVLHDKVALTDCVLGNNVVLNKSTEVCGKRIQSKKSEDAPESLSKEAHVVTIDINNFGENDRIAKIWATSNQLSFNTDYLHVEYDDEDRSETTDDDDNIGNAEQMDDTKLFFNEVFDSLARGFEDKLHCDNLILEINSSRYAYNITLKEVNYNVVKAILSYPFTASTGQQYFQALQLRLQFFSPILLNYIKNVNDMFDCLQAIQDMSIANVELMNCVVKVLHSFYDKELLSECAIINWHSKLNHYEKLYKTLLPLIKWFDEAQEESPEEE